MGWLALLIKNLIVWLDKQSERSSLHALPDLGNLLYDPHEALRGRTIRIGPARRRGTTSPWARSVSSAPAFQTCDCS